MIHNKEYNNQNNLDINNQEDDNFVKKDKNSFNIKPQKKRKSVKKNYLYNLLYQIIVLLTPLITTPYLARILGSSGVGQYSFTYSISTYFILFGALGFGYYAQRTIARHQGDKQTQSVLFWEIIIARLVSSILVISIYIFLILINVYDETYKLLMWILLISVCSTIFDVTFYFQGNEEFGIIALVNSIVRIIGIVFIMIFIKRSDQVWLYALFQSIILILSYVLLWPFLIKKICFINIKRIRFWKHFLPTLRLFIPTIAVSVYTMLDKTLIGILVPGEIENSSGELVKVADIENGYYSQSEKLVKMSLTIITSLGTVMIPRNSQAIANGNKKEFDDNINKALSFVFLLGIPIMFGIAGIAFNFAPWFFGEGYEKVPYLIMMFSPLILIIGLSNVFGIQYLLPQKKDKKYTICRIRMRAGH